METIKRIFQIMRAFPVLMGTNWKDERFCKDLARWKQLCKVQGKDWSVLAKILWEKPEFRNLYIYRNRFRIIYRTWIALWYKPMDTLYIESEDIGGGLFIQHGFSTMIAAKRIGENCWINQQVTIGFGKGIQPPIIGNNVMITCGAKVLGQIHVGDNAIIGANTVVIRDVEDGAVMGGVPARRIR